jgi:SAM-dependent methyltransferase
VLDIGCGEGQVARRVAGYGAWVAGIDPTAGQLVVAAERGGGVSYVRGPAEQLPFAAGSFDAALICLTLEHLDPFEPAIHEVGRVLAPGGCFALFLNHPLLQAPDSGWVDDQIMEPPEQYWRVGAYLVEDVRDEEVAPGVVLPFVHRPLSRYLNLMIDAGLDLRRMLEPAPPPGFLARASEYQQAATIPRLLLLVAERR